MAGTRLLVHITFVVQFVALIVIALLYASLHHHDDDDRSEPFFADRSGHGRLDGGLSAAADDSGGSDGGGFADVFGDALGAITSTLEGIESWVSVELLGEKAIKKPIVATETRPYPFSKLARELQRRLDDLGDDTLVFSDGAPTSARSVSVLLMDEDPSSHDDGDRGRHHHDLLGRSLGRALDLQLVPLLDALGNTNGATEDGEGGVSGADDERWTTARSTIELRARTAAYGATLPEDVVRVEKDVVGANAREGSEEKEEASVDEHGVAIAAKYVVSVGNFVRSLLPPLPSGPRPPPRNSARYDGDGKDVEWIIFVPSRNHAPLRVRYDDRSGAGTVDSESVVFGRGPSSSDNDGPSGASIVDLSLPYGSETTSGKESENLYDFAMSRALTYLVGYVRAMHGLSPISNGEGERRRGLSPRESETIARRTFRPSFVQALRELDALAALLHDRGGELAFSTRLAEKLNRSASHLRSAIGDVEEGSDEAPSSSPRSVARASSRVRAALRLLEEVRSDHRFMEPPYFPPDQCLAVFSPLVLPLILPMMLGLIREAKRYKELTAAAAWRRTQ